MVFLEELTVNETGLNTLFPKQIHLGTPSLKKKQTR